MFKCFIDKYDYIWLTKLKHDTQNSLDYFRHLLNSIIDIEAKSELMDLVDYEEKIIKEIQKTQLEMVRIFKGKK